MVVCALCQEKLLPGLCAGRKDEKCAGTPGAHKNMRLGEGNIVWRILGVGGFLAAKKNEYVRFLYA
jgi:hypothetical protein